MYSVAGTRTPGPKRWIAPLHLRKKTAAAAAEPRGAARVLTNLFCTPRAAYGGSSYGVGVEEPRT